MDKSIDGRLDIWINQLMVCMTGESIDGLLDGKINRLMACCVYG